MSPKFVDGMMLSDGAIRQHLFVAERPRAEFDSQTRRRLIAIIHQDTLVPAPSACRDEGGKTCNGILAVAARVAALAVDQGLKDSLRAVETLARRPASEDSAAPLFETYYASASGAVQACAEAKRQSCDTKPSGSADSFCTEYMRCLADHGRQEGKATGSENPPWKAFDALGIGPLVPQRAK